MGWSHPHHHHNAKQHTTNTSLNKRIQRPAAQRPLHRFDSVVTLLNLYGLNERTEDTGGGFRMSTSRLRYLYILFVCVLVLVLFLSMFLIYEQDVIDLPTTWWSGIGGTTDAVSMVGLRRRTSSKSVPSDSNGNGNGNGNDAARSVACRSNIYIDLGSNIGVQIRKLFEPSKYPNATILNYFTDTFGDEHERRRSTCAFGFEANPKHMNRLQLIEKTYLSKGWVTSFQNKVVHNVDNKTMQFYTKDHSRYQDWGASLNNPLLVGKDKKDVTHYDVFSIDIARWIKALLATHNPNGKVLVKMDIEGAEFQVFPHLLKNGLLCSNIISAIIMEVHWWGKNSAIPKNQPDKVVIAHSVTGLKINIPSILSTLTKKETSLRSAFNKTEQLNEFREALKQQRNCAQGVGPTVLVDLDDEKYLHDGKPL